MKNNDNHNNKIEKKKNKAYWKGVTTVSQRNVASIIPRCTAEKS